MPQYQGVWNLQDAARLQSQQQWVTDPNFRNTTLLLQADNAAGGAQNNTFLDSSSNSFAITRNGNTTQGTFTPFSQGWSNYFGGNGNYFSGTNSNFNVSSGTLVWTLEFWVYPIGTGVFFAIGNGANNGNSMAVDWNRAATNKFSFAQGNGGSYPVSIITSNTYNSNAWYHIAVSKDSSGVIRLFINGIQDGTQTFTSSVSSGTTMVVNGLNDNNGLGNNGGTAYISNLRLVTNTALYTSNFTPSTVPLTAVSGTQLLTCQSNRFVDTSSNSVSLTVAGSPSVQPFAPFAPQFQYTQSGIGGSGFFDGSGDYLTGNAALSSSASMSTFTVEGWIYPTTLANVIWLIGDMSPTGTTNVLAVNIQTSGAVQLYWYDGAGKTATSTSVMRANQWNWFAIVVNSNAISIFVNSTTSGQSGTTTLTGRTQDSNFAVGQYNNSTTPNAYISNLRWSNGIARTISSIPTAPYTSDANTRLLLNFTNAGIIDGTMENVLETVSGAQVNTSVVKYGSGSIRFSGNPDAINFPVPQSFYFGTGDFTVELWANFSSIATSNVFIGNFNNNVTAFGVWTLYWYSTGSLAFFCNGGTNYQSAWTPTRGVWYHIAVSRANSRLRWFVDGSQVGATFTSTDNISFGQGLTQSGGWYIGRSNDGAAYFNGFMDDIRVTPGVARYITNFTPPQVALPRQ